MNVDLEKPVNKLSSLFFFLLGLVFLGGNLSTLAQGDGKSPTGTVEYSKPKEYEIGGINIEGTKHLDKNVLKLLSGLSEGERIQVPGDKLAKAIENLWKQGLFSDVKILVTKIQGSFIFLEIAVTERPRLRNYSFTGVKKSDQDDIRDKVKLVKGKVVTDNLIMATTNTIKEFYFDKGHSNCKVTIKEVPDSSTPNSVDLKIYISKGKKVKIKFIEIDGNSLVADKKLKRSMKDTKEMKWWRVWAASKYLSKKYADDKEKL
ncbi:MAG: outer membrane protein assembly factor BamA, partial [Bacteroidia bacterium]|nr:outer membrane protein assembly factor BamA [Bacteroidia bacterium]